MRKERVLLIDMDVMLYRFAFANQDTIQWDEDTTSYILRKEEAIQDFDSFVEELLQRTGCSAYIMCYSHDYNFRYVVLPTYKHNRQDKEKPKLYHMLKEHALKEHPCTCRKWLEADDLLGIMATKEPGKSIIATIDKDLEQIPGLIYNWNRDTLKDISRRQADWWFYRQILTGDPTDGYTGVPGIGPKKAEKLLNETPEEKWWDMILFEYWKKCLDLDFALSQARVARILRYGEYDFKKEEVKYWEP